MHKPPPKANRSSEYLLVRPEWVGLSSQPCSLVARQNSRISVFIQSSLWGFSGMQLPLITSAPLSNPIHIPISILNKLIGVIVTLFCLLLVPCLCQRHVGFNFYTTEVQEEPRHPSSSILQCLCLGKQKIPSRKAMQLQPTETV